MAKSRRIKSIEPWTFVPANDDSRGLPTVGAGTYSGKGIKAKVGKSRVDSVVSPPKDKTRGFKKPITQA
jgi:hypothetical protein